MNIQVNALYQIAQKKQRRIIGLMSGTSLDGLDIALTVIEGSGRSSKVAVERFTTIPYDAAFKAMVKAIFSKKMVDLQQVCLVNEQIALKHAELINTTLEVWGVSPNDVDLIASHGQTIFHAPISLHGLEGSPNGTLQIGDGDHLAVKTGIITLSDFRQKHIAAGGEGAPLAVYGDYLIFSNPAENRIMLNIGGIANFTYLPSDLDATNIFSTDVGPGNTLMDQFVQQHFPGKYYDENAAIARTGKVNDELLSRLLDHSFFALEFPKTTGPELFNLSYLNDRTFGLDLSPGDILATLAAFSARGIADAIKRCFQPEQQPVVYMSGGGMHNPMLKEFLIDLIPFAVFKTTEELGINPDAKEAVLFAVLANETVAGGPINFGKREGVPAICMGKISLPE